MNCLFCSIAAKKIPAFVVGENEHALAFLDINPRAPGHTIVISRIHAETIIDVDDATLHDIGALVQDVVKLLKQRLSPDGFTIGINHGKVSGQAIDHLHVHIIPRFYGDGGGSLHTVVNNPPKKSVEELYKKIISQ